MRRPAIVIALLLPLALAPLVVRALVPVIGDAIADRFLRLAREEHGQHGEPPLIAPDPDLRDGGAD